MILISNLIKANKEILKALYKKMNKSQKLIPLEDNKNTKVSWIKRRSSLIMRSMYNSLKI